MDEPDDFQEENMVTGWSVVHRERPHSHLSIIEHPTDGPDKNGEGGTSAGLRPIQRNRIYLRSVSMRSDQSKDYPFRSRDDLVDPRLIQRNRSDLRFASTRSNQSMDYPYNFRSRDNHAAPSVQCKRSELSGNNTLDSRFERIEEDIISLVKNELNGFKKLLSLDCSEGEEVDEEDGGVREEVLKITLHVLRKTEHKTLAPIFKSKMLKQKLKKTFQSIKESTGKQQHSTILNEVDMELYTTKGCCEEVRNNLELIEEITKKAAATEETAIKVNEIFKALPGQDKSIRTVLTKGVAGIGKTVSVQKFILNWSEGTANKDIHFVLPLPFRELNFFRGKIVSLKELLQHLFTEIDDLALIDCDTYKVLFIFDGLDECRLSLDFQSCQRVCNVTTRTSVDVLLINLIKGNLLPSALLWITSRPASCGQIPPECVDLETEIRGFNDLQKEEYFRKRISDESLANRIIAHVKSSGSLNIVCHIPVFCWIAATVLEKMLSEANSGTIPKTLTQMFTHFLNIQMNQWSQKYATNKPDPDQIREGIMTLGKLAFQQLEKGNLIYEEDLRDCGIDAEEVSVYSEMCTQIFREEIGLQMGKVFNFVHQSIQGFCGALYVFVLFIISNRKEFDKKIPGFLSSIHNPAMSDLLNNAVDMSLQCENRSLDLFLRFLVGLSLESNQTLLTGMGIQKGHSSHKEETIKYIKKMIQKVPSTEKSINLFHCLNELNDHSLEQEVQIYLSQKGKNRLNNVNLSPAQWSALVFVLLNSKEELNEFNLCDYDPSEECFKKLLPVVKASRKANMNGCNLTEQSCALLASALTSNSSVRELDLSTNNLHDSGVKLLSTGLESPHCKIRILRLCGCRITENSCLTLSFTLRSNVSNLRELDLANNYLQDSGVKLLCDGLERPQCKLEKLGLCNCNITHEGCAVLVSALKSNPSYLKDLNLGMNKLGDSGVNQLCFLLEDPNSKLEKLKLFDCSITEHGCAAMVLAVKSNPSKLRELDLNFNERTSEMKLLSTLLEDPHCKLEKLNF